MDAEAKYWKDKWMESEKRLIGKISPKVVKEFDKASKGKSLPEKVKEFHRKVREY